jgi:hypothetical protein
LGREGEGKLKSKSRKLKTAAGRSPFQISSFSFQLSLPLPSTMDTLWLGYDGLDLPFCEIVAVLLYQPALDARIALTFGSVPGGVKAVVVTSGGAFLPARWRADQLRRRWADWRSGQR